MTVRAGIDTTEIADLYERWANGQRNVARRLARLGDRFDASLKDARAHIRHTAATLLRGEHSQHQLDELAADFMARAASTRVLYPPLVDYDRIAINYTQARSWQMCAWDLDPTLPEVQPQWPDTGI